MIVTEPKLFMLIVAVVILGFGAFWGVVRKLNKSLVRLVTLLLSFVGAFVFVRLVGKSVARYVISLIEPMLNESIVEILTDPEMAQVSDVLCEMLAAPILFLVAYAVLKILSWLLYKLTVAVFHIKGPKRCGRFGGMLVGILCGVIGLVVFVTPVQGYMTFAENVLSEIRTEEASSEEQTPTEQEASLDMLNQMLEAPVTKQAYGFAGRHVFRLLTTVSFEEGQINLEEETNAIVKILKDATVLSESSFDQYSERETAAIKQVASDVGASKIVSTVAAFFLSDAAEAWLNGEEAFGMAKPDMGEDVQGIADAFLVVFSKASSATLSQDLVTFADVFTVLVENDVFAMGGNTADFVQKLVSDGVVVKLYTVLDSNPRMAPIKSAIRDTGVRVMMSHLGIAEDIRENHGEMLEDMADTLKNATAEDGNIDEEALSAGIHDVMSSHDIEVSEEASQLIAEAATEYLTAEEIRTLPIAELADKLAERFMAAGNTMPSVPDAAA